MLFKNKNDVKTFLQEYIHKMDQCTDDAYKCDHNALAIDIKMFAESKDIYHHMEEKLFEDCNCNTCDPERNNCKHRNEVC